MVNLEFKNPLSDTSEYIYHYTSVDTLLKYILPQKRLRFSPLENTNDPEERKWHISCAVGEPGDDWEDFCIHDKLNEISSGIANNARIICFSQDDSDSSGTWGGLYYTKGFARPRMWAQYAQNHTGVCLVFKRDNVVSVFNETFGDEIHYAGNVSYEPIVSILSENLYAQELLPEEVRRPVADLISEKIRKYHKVYYFSKHKDWHTENEYRLLAKPETNSDSFLDIDGLLEYIILGDKTENCLCSPIQILLSQFSQKPELLRFGYNRNSYTFMPINAQRG